MLACVLSWGVDEFEGQGGKALVISASCKHRAIVYTWRKLYGCIQIYCIWEQFWSCCTSFHEYSPGLWVICSKSVECFLQEKKSPTGIHCRTAVSLEEFPRKPRSFPSETTQIEAYPVMVLDLMLINSRERTQLNGLGCCCCVRGKVCSRDFSSQHDNTLNNLLLVKRSWISPHGIKFAKLPCGFCKHFANSSRGQTT